MCLYVINLFINHLVNISLNNILNFIFLYLLNNDFHFFEVQYKLWPPICKS